MALTKRYLEQQCSCYKYCFYEIRSEIWDCSCEVCHEIE